MVRIARCCRLIGLSTIYYVSELLGNYCWNVELLKYSLIAIPVTLYCCFDRSLQGSDRLVVRRKKGVGLSKSLLRIHYPSGIGYLPLIQLLIQILHRFGSHILYINLGYVHDYIRIGVEIRIRNSFCYFIVHRKTFFSWLVSHW